MPVVSEEAIRIAVRNIGKWGDTDVFPFPIDNHIFHDSEDEVVALVVQRTEDFTNTIAQDAPLNTSALCPVGYNGFRWATQIDPLWNAHLLALVVDLAPQIEAARIPEDDEVVFSYRYRTGTDDSSLFDREGWSKFGERSRQLATEHEYVVVLDIADFYGRIYHHRLENELHYVEPDSAHAKSKQIMRLLGTFSDRVSYGLPVGGPAARILSELLLSPTDHLLAGQQPRFRFTRYADDYRFFSDSLEDAYRAVGFLSDKLQRNEGLSLQRSKTRIMSSHEYLSAHQPQEPRQGSAAKFLSLRLHYDAYSATAADDYEELKEQLDEFDVLGLLRAELSKGRVDSALTKRLTGVIEHLPEPVREQAILSMMDNLETLAPILPQMLRVIRKNLEGLSEGSRDKVCQMLRDLIETGHHLARVDVNLAYMVRVLAHHRTRDNEHLLQNLFARSHGYAAGPAPNIQRDIILALARWESRYWLHDLRPYYSTLHPWARRAFAISTFVLGDEGRHWRQNNKATLGPYDKLHLAWAEERIKQSQWQVPL